MSALAYEWKETGLKAISLPVSEAGETIGVLHLQGAEKNKKNVTV